MKKKALPLILLLCYVFSVKAQTSDDFIAIDEGVYNISELKTQFKNHPYQLIIEGIEVNAIEQIAQALKDGSYDNLHIFVMTKPGSIVFNNCAVIPEYVENFSEAIAKWKNSISGKVYVHSDHVFLESSGEALENKLELMSGLDFVVQ